MLKEAMAVYLPLVDDRKQRFTKYLAMSFGRISSGAA
jgi:hypothetical protein